MTKAYADFPVCLYTTGTVAIGAVYTPDADDLQNHFDTPIQIEEIRFLLYFNSANAFDGLAHCVRVQIKMGRIDLTNGYVPVNLLGSRLQLALEVMNGNSSAGKQSTWDYQRWKLPVPMLVPAGSTLMPTFTYLLPDGTLTLGDPSESPITVYVALIGRSLGNMPSGRINKIKVPYATAFIANTTTGGQQSGDDQLVNKFNVPLHVQRLIGRLIFKTGDAPDSWRTDEGSSATLLGKQLMIKDNAGYYLVGQMTNWHDVFDKSRKILPVGGVLEPRGWYTVLLADKPNAVAATAYIPMISMIGWREEELLP